MCRLTVQFFILEIQVLKSFYGKYPPNAFFFFFKRISKPRALSSSLMKYNFPINRKVLHFKRLNRMLLENSFQLVKLKNWNKSKERIFSWHLSFDSHLDKFPFAPRTCLVSEFCSSETKKEVLIGMYCTSSLTRTVYTVALTVGDGLILGDTFAVIDYTRCWYYSSLFHHFMYQLTVLSNSHSTTSHSFLPLKLFTALWGKKCNSNPELHHRGKSNYQVSHLACATPHF